MRNTAINTSPFFSQICLRDFLNAAAAFLDARGTESPRLSAQILLAHALGLDRGELLKLALLEPDRELPESARRAAGELLERRSRGEPTAYLTGKKEFYGREFLVTPATLIPRPETELLVDLALEAAGERGTIGTGETAGPEETAGRTEKRARKNTGGSGARFGVNEGGRPFMFADFGTGSGCLAVTLALEAPGWTGLALDHSRAALETARENARRLGAAHVLFLRADFTRPPLRSGGLDLLVGNPPYVSEAEYARLDRQVRDFEPKSALVPAPAPAGNGPPEGCGPEDGFGHAYPEDGTGHARRIIAVAARLLRPGGRLLMEMGHAQGAALLTALTPGLWRDSRVHKDLAGLDRVLEARRL